MKLRKITIIAVALTAYNVVRAVRNHLTAPKQRTKPEVTIASTTFATNAPTPSGTFINGDLLIDYRGIFEYRDHEWRPL